MSIPVFPKSAAAPFWWVALWTRWREHRRLKAARAGLARHIASTDARLLDDIGIDAAAASELVEDPGPRRALLFGRDPAARRH